jgi:hypothetical protein
MPQHPEAHVRRAVRVLAMVGELHRRGYQKLRVMPFMSPSGNAWRCWIGPDTLFYRDHGAYLRAAWDLDETQSTSLTAPYTTGAKHYFNWQDADQDDPDAGRQIPGPVRQPCRPRRRVELRLRWLVSEVARPGRARLDARGSR